MISNHLPRKPKDTTPKRSPVVHPNIKAIFHDRFRVLMNQMDIMPLEERREFGSASTGDRGIDKAMAISLVPVYLTINDMIHNFNNGIPMRLSNPDNAKTIYESITNHTGAWRKALEHVMNVGKAPVEDLITLENFAGSIYERAKFTYVERPKGNFQKGSLAEFLYSNNRVEGNMFSASRGWNSSGAMRTQADVRNQKHTPNISVFRDIMMQNMTFEDDNV